MTKTFFPSSNILSEASLEKSGAFSFNLQQEIGKITDKAIRRGVISIDMLVKHNKVVLVNYLCYSMTNGEFTKNPPLSLGKSTIQKIERKLSKDTSFYFTVGEKARQELPKKVDKKLLYHYYYVLHHLHVYPYITRYKSMEGTPIHHDTLKKTLGRFASEVLHNLKEWGVVSCDYHHIKGMKSYHYKLNPEYKMNMKNIPCLNPDVRDRLLARRELFLHRGKDNFHIVSGHIKDIRVNKDAAFKKIARMTTSSKGKVYTADDKVLFRNLIHNIDNEIIYCKQDKYSGRIHTNLTVLPRWLRKYVTVDNEELVQVDMPTAQPMLLHRAMRKVGYNSKELFKYKQLVESGKFYEYFDDLLPNLPRHEKKILLLIQLFFDKPRKRVYKTWERFEIDFPEIARFVKEVRAENYKEMPRLLQSEEVDFIRAVLNEFKERHPHSFISTIHDCIVVKRSDKEKALEVMQWMYNKERYKVDLKIKEINE